MKFKLKGLAFDTILYGFGNAFTASYFLIFIPVVVNKITIGDYGRYNYYNTIISIFVVVFLFGIDSTLALFLNDYNEKKLRSKVFSFSLLILVSIGIIGGICIICLYLFTTSLVFLNKYFLSLIYLNVFFLSIYRFFLSWFKWDGKSKYFILITGLFFLINLLLLLLSNKITLFDLFCFNLLSLLFSCLVAVKLSYSFFINPFPTLIPLEKILFVSFPFFIISLGSIFRSNLDKILLVNKINEIDFGIYSFVQRISLILGLFSFAFDVALGPYIFSNWEKQNFKNEIVKIQTIFIYLICIIQFYFFLFLNEIILIIGKGKFESEGINYIFFLTTANIFWGLNSFSSIGINIKKKSVYFLIGFFFSTIVFLTANTLLNLKPEVSISVSFFLSTFSLICINYFISFKFYKINFEFVNNILILTFGLILSYSVYYFDLCFKTRIVLLCASIFVFYFIIFKFNKFGIFNN